MTFNAQELNQRIEIEQPVQTQDPNTGFVTIAWVTFATVWAKAEPALGRELFAADAIQVAKPVKFTMRWFDGVSAAMRIVWRGDNYNIRSVADFRGKRREMVIHTEGGLNDG